jgi:hypothetical protein
MSRAEQVVLAVAAAVALAGCQSIMGVDPVTTDRDGDRIADDVDVCPQDYDPLQLDTDGDGTGDACDACVHATYDLDDDGRDDSCDACIGPGPSGLDADGDGIDDGCDPCVGDVGTTGSDIDGDGIDDGCDACIGNGIDLDRDGVVDNCDACLFGPNDEDEDADGVADSCDGCPATADPDQEHTPDEDIGLACDPDPQRNDVRRMFDGFSILRRGIWVDNAEWETTGGVVHVKGAVGRRAAYYSVRAEFAMSTFVRFDASSAVGATLGISGWAERGIRVLELSCSLDSAGLVTFDGLTDNASLLDSSKGVRLTVSRRGLSDGSFVAACEAVDGNGKHVVLTESTISREDLDVSLTSNGAQGSFEWIDVIDHPLPLPVNSFK